jgi:hypothetical protein
MHDEGKPITDVYRFLVSQGKQLQQSLLRNITNVKRYAGINVLPEKNPK